MDWTCCVLCWGRIHFVVTFAMIIRCCTNRLGWYTTDTLLRFSAHTWFTSNLITVINHVSRSTSLPSISWCISISYQVLFVLILAKVRNYFSMSHRLHCRLRPWILVTLIESVDHHDGWEKQIFAFPAKASKGIEISQFSSWIIKLKSEDMSYTYQQFADLQLDGSLAGDEGFDPLGLSNIEELGIGEKKIDRE